MGRQLKRVALDFDWPIEKVWRGYINPHYAHCHNCRECEGSGSSPMARKLKDRWYGYAPFRPEDRGSQPFPPNHPAILAQAARNVNNNPGCYGNEDAAINREAMRLSEFFNREWSHHLNADDVAALVKDHRLIDFTHTWTPGKGWQLKSPPYIPTPEEVNVWSLSGFGHDTINQWVVVSAECDRLGVKKTCEHCNGEGSLWDTPEDKQAADDWMPTEPPSGDGYQIWETVSEGSSISPVFRTPEELAAFMEKTRWGADEGTSYDNWLKFILGPGWAPSLLGDASGLRSGVQAVVERAEQNKEE